MGEMTFDGSWSFGAPIGGNEAIDLGNRTLALYMEAGVPITPQQAGVFLADVATIPANASTEQINARMVEALARAGITLTPAQERAVSDILLRRADAILGQPATTAGNPRWNAYNLSQEDIQSLTTTQLDLFVQDGANIS